MRSQPWLTFLRDLRRALPAYLANFERLQSIGVPADPILAELVAQLSGRSTASPSSRKTVEAPTLSPALLAHLDASLRASSRLICAQPAHVPSTAVSDSGYLFDNAALEADDRFGALAALFDPVTFRHLDRLDVGEGWRCLEVGAGGGSVARWLATRVGESGHVLATDLDPRWLERGARPERRGAPAQHRRRPAARSPFDLAHERLVLMHIPEREAALRSMVASVRPGGWLLVEDFDSDIAPEAFPAPRSADEELGNTMVDRSGRCSRSAEPTPRSATSCRDCFVTPAWRRSAPTPTRRSRRVTRSARCRRANIRQVGVALVEQALVSRAELERYLALLDERQDEPELAAARVGVGAAPTRRSAGERDDGVEMVGTRRRWWRDVEMSRGAGAGAFRAMRVRNYRLFFAGQVLSVIGTWTQATAVGWIVLRETHDSTGLGIVVALQFFPLLVFGAYAGTLADRIDKRRILIVANVSAAVIALATALLVSGGHRSVAVLAVASLLLGGLHRVRDADPPELRRRARAARRHPERGGAQRGDDDRRPHRGIGRRRRAARGAGGVDLPVPQRGVVRAR